MMRAFAVWPLGKSFCRLVRTAFDCAFEGSALSVLSSVASLSLLPIGDIATARMSHPASTSHFVRRPVTNRERDRMRASKEFFGVRADCPQGQCRRVLCPKLTPLTCLGQYTDCAMRARVIGAPRPPRPAGRSGDPATGSAA